MEVLIIMILCNEKVLIQIFYFVNSQLWHLMIQIWLYLRLFCMQDRSARRCLWMVKYLLSLLKNVGDL